VTPADRRSRTPTPSTTGREAAAAPSDRKEQALTTVDTTESRALAVAIARAAADKKARDIVILDLGTLLGITDYFVICSATNERQLGTVVNEIAVRLKQQDRAPRRREGGKDTGWMLLDYGDVVLHAFTEEQREFYGLERLWADAPAVSFEDGRPPSAAALPRAEASGA
jgi:ribosome-associated protein